MRSKIELIVIDNAMTLDAVQTLQGDNLVALLKQAFDAPTFPSGARLFYESLTNDVTPQSKDDVDALMQKSGVFYAYLAPEGLLGFAGWLTLGVSVAVSVGLALMMPKTPNLSTAYSQPPSPNNALASRTNTQRLGGRVPDIVGQVWAIPDLIAPTYSVYVDNTEIEFSYMCLGRGFYEVDKALDDTTDIEYISGACVQVYEPGKSFLWDDPQIQFGNNYTDEESRLSGLATKRYTAVNGQTLEPPDNSFLGENVVFVAPNIITAQSVLDYEAQKAHQGQSAAKAPPDPFGNLFKAGDTLHVSEAENLPFDVAKRQAEKEAKAAAERQKAEAEAAKAAAAAANGQNGQNGADANGAATPSQSAATATNAAAATTASGAAPATTTPASQSGGTSATPATPAATTAANADPDDEPLLNLNGSYKIQSIQGGKIYLQDPKAVNPDWEKLTEATEADSVTLSTVAQNIWTDWFYTDASDWDDAMINIVAPSGLYYTNQHGEHVTQSVDVLIQSEIVNDDNTPVLGTQATKNARITGRRTKRYFTKEIVVKKRRFRSDKRATVWVSADDEARRSAARTVFVENPHYKRGDRMRVRLRRLSNKIRVENASVSDEVRVKDMYGIRRIAGESVYPDATTVYVKQKATEGALALKERKLRLRAYRKLNSPSGFVLSKQAEDILHHLATDPKIGNLSEGQINTAQIRAEMEVLRDYFGGGKYGEFCHTFDDNNLSSEETLQIVAQAVFGQLYRLNNQVHLHFERPQPVGVALFNSYNIAPDSYKRSESFGVNKNYDGVVVKYQNPKDDAQATLKTSESALNPSEHTLVGVRNKRQAFAHMMRIWQKQKYSHKTVEFEGLDESNIVIKSQRIDVVDPLRAKTIQGVIVDLQQGAQIVATLSEDLPADFTDGVLFVQTTKGEVDAIAAQKYSDNRLALERMPRFGVSTSGVVQAAYTVVQPYETGKNAYIVTAKEPTNGVANRLSAINYDERYYAYDKETP